MSLDACMTCNAPSAVQQAFESKYMCLAPGAAEQYLHLHSCSAHPTLKGFEHWTTGITATNRCHDLAAAESLTFAR